MSACDIHFIAYVHIFVDTHTYMFIVFPAISSLYGMCVCVIHLLPLTLLKYIRTHSIPN